MSKKRVARVVSLNTYHLSLIPKVTCCCTINPMTENTATQAGPPKLRPGAEGGVDPSSIADLVEWFLNYDERTARMRHQNTEELFQWKQQDDEANGVGTYPFENAEARFAIGCFQALQENNSEPLLGLWLNDVLAALHESRETRREVTEANDLDKDIEKSSMEKGVAAHNEQRTPSISH